MTGNRSSSVPAEVVIAGGGVAALEALIALRRVAGERVAITLVAPEPEFAYRPMLVAEPFGLGRARRSPLGPIASDFGARLVQTAVVSVDASEHRVGCRSGATLKYDTLILAPGAWALQAFDQAIAFGEPGSGADMRSLLADVEQGDVRRVAFVAPTAAGWTLPLYELALMTAGRARSQDIDGAGFFLITPEDRPLTVFGDQASVTVARLLAEMGIDFIGSTYADVRDGAVLLDRARPPLAVDRVVALPLVRGRELNGVPAEPEYGFIPVDRHGRVTGLEDVYAAGDATDFPIKQGGLACQQADAVAHHVAARYGAPVEPDPFRPVLQGMLFTGAEPRFLRSEAWGSREGSVSAQPLWLPATKIAGRYLAPYLSASDEAEATDRPSRGFADVEIPVGEISLPPRPVPLGRGAEIARLGHPHGR